MAPTEVMFWLSVTSPFGNWLRQEKSEGMFSFTFNNSSSFSIVISEFAIIESLSCQRFLVKNATFPSYFVIWNKAFVKLTDKPIAPYGVIPSNPLCMTWYLQTESRLLREKCDEAFWIDIFMQSSRKIYSFEGFMHCF